ncbi:MAG TPA: hypothetical protein VFE90_23800 [Myxococcales bacterium]|nr:hypothetical protein [Myxococcales bacterium]
MRVSPVTLMAACAVAALAGSPARADVRFQIDSPLNLFVDPSWFVWTPNRIAIRGDPESPVHAIVEAQIAPNLFLPQLHIGNLTERSGELVISAVVTPMIRLRVLNEKSSPVIPPSFMPKLTLQVVNLRALSPINRTSFSALAMGVNLVLGHYSNGQAGCLYENQTGSDPDCTPQPGQLPVNERSGSFSTNYLRLELHGRVGLGIDVENRSAWAFLGGMAVEKNSSIGPGGISDDQRRVYGDGHLWARLGAERSWFGHRARLTGSISAPFGESPYQQPTTTAELTVLPRWGAGFGAIVRWVHGQDDYNILFMEPVNLWQFGITFELGPGIRLPAQPPAFTN